ncbi:Glucose transporter type 1, partial [Sarcoptes scabiei]
TVNQLGVTIGLLLSQILGLPQILGTEDGWPFLLGVAFIPAILQLMLLPQCPESPRYLWISKGRLTEATYALQRLRCTTNVEDDIEEMRIEDRAQHNEAKQITMLQLIKNRSLQTPLIIGIVMQLSQQLSGINAVFYYSTNIFTIAGLGEYLAKYSTIGVGVVMVLMSLVSMMLMDRTGRRTLHLYGLGGMFITSMFLTIFLLFGFLYTWMSYMSVISTLIYVVFFAIGPGSIPWLITAELFSQGPRPAAISIAASINWFMNFFVGLAFPIMINFKDKIMDKYAFLPFTGFLALFWIFTYFKVPETKNRTFEEISALFRKDDSDNLIQIEDVQSGNRIQSFNNSNNSSIDGNLDDGNGNGNLGPIVSANPTGLNSRNSSSGEIYSHKSSSAGEVVFGDERNYEKYYLPHHHFHPCRYENDSSTKAKDEIISDCDNINGARLATPMTPNVGTQFGVGNQQQSNSHQHSNKSLLHTQSSSLMPIVALPPPPQPPPSPPSSSMLNNPTVKFQSISKISISNKNLAQTKESSYNRFVLPLLSQQQNAHNGDGDNGGSILLSNDSINHGHHHYHSHNLHHIPTPNRSMKEAIQNPSLLPLHSALTLPSTKDGQHYSLYHPLHNHQLLIENNQQNDCTHHHHHHHQTESMTISPSSSSMFLNKQQSLLPPTTTQTQQQSTLTTFENNSSPPLSIVPLNTQNANNDKINHYHYQNTSRKKVTMSTSIINDLGTFTPNHRIIIEDQL